ncbi:MAG: nuclear transport factor 2 family protein [Ferruginibacter sp.]
MKNIIQQYLQALESGDEEKITRLFADNAIVYSPLYGEVQANHFFKGLFADTSRSEITLLNTFSSLDNPETCAAQFRYDWTLKNGTETNFDCVDIFQFDDQDKIKSLTIIYDTYKIRGKFEDLDVAPI